MTKNNALNSAHTADTITAFDTRTQTGNTLRVANDEGDRGWAEELVARVGRAVKAARQGKSAAWLSDRTAQLGYRVSPTVIAKLDSGHRGSVLSVPELLILAAALEVPPAALLYPGMPDELVWMLPHVTSSSELALLMWAGRFPPLPARSFQELWESAKESGGEPRHPAAILVETVWQRIDALNSLQRMRDEIQQPADDDPIGQKQRDLQHQQIALAEHRIAQLNAKIESLGGTVEKGAADA